MDSAGLLQDSMPSPPTETATGAARFRPYASTSHQVTKGRYITSNDPRGYIPVYEYPLNGQWIMMDIDDGYILWTGIWKALGNAKADIVRMLESQPDLAPQLRRVRGGYLKIQGTWMPYEIALRLARRVAWPIREDLIPLFGPTFPSTCLSPDQPGYGQVVTNTSGRRRVRRNVLSTSSTKVHPRPQQSRSQPAKPGASVSPETPVQRSHLESFAPQRHEQHAESSKHPHLFQGAYSPQDPNSSFAERMRRSPPKPLNIPNLSTSASDFADTVGSTPATYPPSGYEFTGSIRSMRGVHSAPVTQASSDALSPNSPMRERGSLKSRYTPYGPTPRASSTRSPAVELPQSGEPSRRLSPLSVPTDRLRERPRTASASLAESIHLPPLQTVTSDAPPQGSHFLLNSVSLPPISSLYESHVSASSGDAAAVLRRLTLDDETLGLARHRRHAGESEQVMPTPEQLWTRRRSLSEPPLHQDMVQRSSLAPVAFESRLSRHRIDSEKSLTAHRRSPPHNYNSPNIYHSQKPAADSSLRSHDAPTFNTSPSLPAPSFNWQSDRDSGGGLSRQTPAQAIDGSTAWPMHTPGPPIPQSQRAELQAYRFGNPVADSDSSTYRHSGAITQEHTASPAHREDIP